MNESVLTVTSALRSGRICPVINPIIYVDFIEVQLDTCALLKGNLHIQELSIENPLVDLRIAEDGSTSLDPLLRPASEEADQAAANSSPTARDTSRGIELAETLMSLLRPGLVSPE